MVDQFMIQMCGKVDTSQKIGRDSVLRVHAVTGLEYEYYLLDYRVNTAQTMVGKNK
jgi:hypothetical protein